MVASMTAFARVELASESGNFTWELRSVNHRYLEPYLRLPEEFRALEPQLRELLGQQLKRGKVECSLRFQAQTGSSLNYRVNEPLVRHLIALSAQVREMTGQREHLKLAELMRWPGVLIEQALDVGSIHGQAMELFRQALQQLQQDRRREGSKLAEIVQQRNRQMGEHLAAVRQRAPQMLGEVQERIAARLQEVREQLEPQRLEQEMVLISQRLDVDEELERLGVHIEELDNILERPGPHGRRLDFLLQELNRETNTLTSKSSDIAITRHAVDMKVLIEQMREQIQNIE
jgi:uncharacterized protein (TIGR00255 family)